MTKPKKTVATKTVEFIAPQPKAKWIKTHLADFSFEQNRGLLEQVLAARLTSEDLKALKSAMTVSTEEASPTREELQAKVDELTEVLKHPTFVHVLERIEHDGFGNKMSDGYLIFKTEKHAMNYMEAEVTARGGRRELEAGDFTYLNKGSRVAVPDVVIALALEGTGKLHIRNLDLLLINEPVGGYAAKPRKFKVERAKSGPKTFPSADEVYAD